jgi:hypothetical protein
MRSNSDAHVASLAERFPAWACWFGIDCLWHARIRGATPPVMVEVRMPKTLPTRSCDGNAYMICTRACPVDLRGWVV